jgi:hypothetical protein
MVNDVIGLEIRQEKGRKKDRREASERGYEKRFAEPDKLTGRRKGMQSWGLEEQRDEILFSPYEMFSHALLIRKALEWFGIFFYLPTVHSH